MRLRWWLKRKPTVFLYEVASVGISAEEIEAIEYSISILRIEAKHLYRDAALAKSRGGFEQMFASEMLAEALTRRYENIQAFIERATALQDCETTQTTNKETSK